MTSVNLAALPPISFADADATTLETAIINAYESLSGITLQPADPVRLFLESLAYLVSVQNSIIDLAGKQNLLAYASGASLDHLGALMGVARIPAQPARCVLRFSIAEPLDFMVPVPAGTRVSTQDGRTSFATEFSTEIRAGETGVEVAALCVQAGSDASGLVAGQISTLVDPLPYVISATNIDASVDGSDIEDDARLRERIRLAPEAFTVAGSSGQYEARVLAVSADIEAVSVHSPEPGVVDVRFVLSGGELPDEAMIELVAAELSAETVRPLTDNVLVGAPDVVNYSINGRWYLKKEDATLLGAVTQAIEKALADFLVWQRGRPGRDINPSRLISVIQQAGAKRVELEEPVFQPLSPVQIAREDIVSLVFGGLEDE